MTALKQKAWLGLGGNIGDPVASMAKALRALNERSETRVLSVSPVYKRRHGARRIRHGFTMPAPKSRLRSIRKRYSQLVSMWKST